VGAAGVPAGAISTSRRTRATASAWIGRSATADIAPWYDHVEEFIGISGEALGLPQLPDGKFLPPMTLNCARQVVREGVAKRFAPERVVTIGRVAILTAPHGGRAACHYCGPCERGCITHSYFNSIGVTLPAARATGRLTLRPYSVVESVLYDERRDRATGVRVIDAQTHQALEFHARVVFLCASTLESDPHPPQLEDPPLPRRARERERCARRTSWTTSWAAGRRG